MPDCGDSNASAKSFEILSLSFCEVPESLSGSSFAKATFIIVNAQVIKSLFFS